MTDRYQVIVWPPMGLWHKQSYHVYDTHTHHEVLGRWDTREAAQAHADKCNQQEQQ